MEDRTGEAVLSEEITVESEEISDAFLCCVCLELVHKPIVLSCGHFSCFWCVHKSMSNLRQSQCPICRHPYSYFPSICQMLHFLLMKMYPITYKKREECILREEEAQNCFSPQFDAPVSIPNAVEDSNCQGNPTDPLTAGKLESSSQTQDQTAILTQASNGTSQKVEEMDLWAKHYSQVSVADLLCSACRKLLFRPVVFNCGHVYCEDCVVCPADENEMIKCQVCQSFDPRRSPKVCLEIHNFLEENFPEEYAKRRDAVQLKQDCSQNHGVSLTPGDHLPRWADRQSLVHIAVGCDSCGMFPIIGNRYKCRDCVEAIGYDLCGDCYNTRSKLPGRFNQQHTSEHRFRAINIRTLRLMPLAGRSEDDESGYIVVDDGPDGLVIVEPSFSVPDTDSPESNGDGPDSSGAPENSTIQLAYPIADPTDIEDNASLENESTHPATDNGDSQDQNDTTTDLN